MNKIVLMLIVALVASCGQNEPTETVESLASDPVRLHELQRQCKLDREKVGEVLCNRVAEAASRRFFGDKKTPYNPPQESPKF